MVIPMQALLSCRDRAFGIVVGALLLAGLVIARISGWQAGLQAPFSFRRASGMVSAATPVIHACQAYIIAWSDLHVLYSKAPMLIAPVCWLHKFLIYRFLMQTTEIRGCAAHSAMKWGNDGASGSLAGVPLPAAYQ